MSLWIRRNRGGSDKSVALPQNPGQPSLSHRRRWLNRCGGIAAKAGQQARRRCMPKPPRKVLPIQ
ncbi:hypothetical protein [Candidatus Methanoperedens sp. BLZ2]|uniref:hypothetical protein n=1 Tax=Candidatus Methanoperedens sp. BLZ2 TaxID=2035255 RepID=UPI0011422ACD|nr:hypothetical protein [Candidatus Methanoperedens sp. BLZ2]KAB2946751.1 MAG: hypothetical protein F9K14_06245 [Candidatus Methanoperedens sp.]MBZ0175829.1 hypothetical protein [Candidatus Methanoperedens nitroreducens]